MTGHLCLLYIDSDHLRKLVKVTIQGKIGEVKSVNYSLGEKKS